jgi:hypothetical protein
MTGASINATSCFSFLSALEGRPAGSRWRAIGHLLGQGKPGTSGNSANYRNVWRIPDLSKRSQRTSPRGAMTVLAQVITADCLSLTRRCQAGWQSRKTSRGSNA